jgi:hypothetical protein
MTMKNLMSCEASLHRMVEKWLAPRPEACLRVTLFKRMRSKCRGYVCVEARYSTEVVSIVFFRHADGAWRVYPPEPNRPTMIGAVVAQLSDGERRL